MEKNSNINFFRKVQGHISVDQYDTIIDELFHVPDIVLEALWNLLVAGYPVRFSLANYLNLFEYARDNNLDYSVAIETYYCLSYGIKEQKYVTELAWYEMN